MVLKYFKILLKFFQECINNKNRKRLTNFTPTLICSNCTGGFLYHWLGLQFRSPFINLYMSNEDFLTALEKWDIFLKTEITEVKRSQYSYPVGRSIDGILIHFVHYKNFEEALYKWKKRLVRIDSNNMAVMLTNLDYSIKRAEIENYLLRFDNLPFKNKVVFVDKPYPQFKSAFYLKGYGKVSKKKNIYATQYLDGRRYIDQFDYISFINHLQD